MVCGNDFIRGSPVFGNQPTPAVPQLKKNREISGFCHFTGTPSSTKPAQLKVARFLEKHDSHEDGLLFLLGLVRRWDSEEASVAVSILRTLLQCIRDYQIVETK